MLTRLLSSAPSVLFRSLSRSFSTYPRVMAKTNGHVSTEDCSKPLLPHAARLEEGRAIVEDVWSIFKSISQSFPFKSMSDLCYLVRLTCPQTVLTLVKVT